MPKRFTATEIWDEDWFIGMPVKHQLFWFYVKDDCDHAGIWKPKLKRFQAITRLRIDFPSFLVDVNDEKERIRLLNNGRWFLPDFFVFQYGTTFNENNRVHQSVLKTLKNNGLSLKSIRGLVEVK